MTIASTVRHLSDGLLAVAWGLRCAACDAPLEHPTRGVVCAGCWSRIQLIERLFCETCGLPGGEDTFLDDVVWQCGVCRADATRMRRRAAGLYDGTLRAVVHALKYDGRLSLAPPLAGMMCQVGVESLAEADYAVPVPLHPLRRWTRGFNQAAALAQHLGLPVIDALRRRRPTAPQTTLTAPERRRNVKGAFGLRRRIRLRGSGVTLDGCSVVLVDDVYTTGATLDACARVLRQAGARTVTGLTAAVTQPTGRPRRPLRRPNALRPHAAKKGPRPAEDSSA